MAKYSAMAVKSEGVRIARKRIAEEARKKTGSLDLGDLELSEMLSDLARLHHLRRLNIGVGRYWDLPDFSGEASMQLTPLTALTELRELYCDGTHVSDLEPLRGLRKLQTLDCSYSKITRLNAVSSLKELRWLECAGTGVSDLRPLLSLEHLENLDLSGCNLEDPFADLWEKPSLRYVNLLGATIPGVPDEILTDSDNHLQLIRAHLRDLAEGSAARTDVKLIFLGNGRVGKTQLGRRLRGEPFQPQWDSTHGVLVKPATLISRGIGEPTRLNLWDFGGQDIYHGTHALFMKTRAIFVVLWSKDTENANEYQENGIRFRNYPLQYWMEYVRHLGNPESALLVLQTKCDEPEDEVRRFPISDRYLTHFDFCKLLHYSAKRDRGRAALEEVLCEAVSWLLNPKRGGIPVIGIGRLRVQRRLEAMRETDEVREPTERKFRTITQDDYRRICEEEKGISSPELLLEYLNNCGVLFYRPDLFEGRIVIDQAGTLAAIYSVFNREGSYRELRRLHGRFTRSLLELLVWSDYCVAEQELFLSMMRSCGICFTHRVGEEDGETEYIAPDLLPARKEVERELEEKWRTADIQEIVFDYALLHLGVIREVIARIGSDAGMHGLYWLGGLCVYETQLKSHALIQQEMSGDWQGLIRVQTQGINAEELLGYIAKIVEDCNERQGLKPKRQATLRSESHPVRVASAESPMGERKRPPEAEYGATPKTRPEWYVSYAWGDQTKDGRAREEVVDFICAKAEETERKIRRDKNEVPLGESISKFMKELGRADRVFIVLSDKYLRSAFCMYELFEVWRNNRSDPDQFWEHTRVYAMPEVKIGSLLERNKYAIYWEDWFKEAEGTITRRPRTIGEKDWKEWKLAGEFYSKVSDILAAIADRILPRTLEELKSYGFAE